MPTEAVRRRPIGLRPSPKRMRMHSPESWHRHSKQRPAANVAEVPKKVANAAEEKPTLATRQPMRTPADRRRTEALLLVPSPTTVALVPNAANRQETPTEAVQQWGRPWAPWHRSEQRPAACVAEVPEEDPITKQLMEEAQADEKAAEAEAVAHGPCPPCWPPPSWLKREPPPAHTEQEVADFWADYWSRQRDKKEEVLIQKAKLAEEHAQGHIRYRKRHGSILLEFGKEEQQKQIMSDKAVVPKQKQILSDYKKAKQEDNKADGDAWESSEDSVDDDAIPVYMS